MRLLCDVLSNTSDPIWDMFHEKKRFVSIHRFSWRGLTFFLFQKKLKKLKKLVKRLHKVRTSSQLQFRGR